MSEVTREPGTFAPVPKRERKSPAHQIWPTAAIGFGLGLTAMWVCFLGYGLVKIVELMI